jgi:hypothetical protein
MIPEEKAELAALLQEKMRKRERWPKMKLLPETKFINGITVISAQIALPSPATVEERPAT